MTMESLLPLALTVLTLVAVVFWGLSERRRADEASAMASDLGARLSAAEERGRLLEDARSTMAEAFAAVSAKTVDQASEAFLKRAEENFKARETLAHARMETVLKPVAETLAKFETQVLAIEKARVEETGGLKEQIAALMTASVATQDEARKLSAALRRGAGVQGRWGEQTLRNVLEAAGLQNRFDFEEQFSVDTDEGRRRPDVKVHMPGGGVFVIDAKVSLNGFMESLEAVDDAARDAALTRHGASVRAHMGQLSAKAYWDQFATSPDFVAMFVPGDGFLAAALDRLPDLMTEAMDRKVLLVTPTTLFALCKAVAYGWRIDEQSKNADQVANLGKELYKRLSVMGGHAAALGKALDGAVGRYNSFVGSLESQVMTQARRFEELAVDHEGKDLIVLEPVETAVRPVTKLLGDDRDPALGAS
jgi:DNA recombination protein RmuC